MSNHPKNCPLAGVDRRLEDAHQLWHRAEAEYFDPESFRLFAQNTIQTLRTVTWRLQNHKKLFADFDAWYGPWQERMRADRLMKWLHDARTKIEHQGDLEIHSFIRAEIVASYLSSEVPRMEVRAELFATAKELLKGIPKDALEKHVLKNGTLRIQRRWVENNLPNHELLDALAIVYGRTKEIVHDAHRKLGLPEPMTVDSGTGEKFNAPALSWRMPCMIAHEARRELLISLADGSRLSFVPQTLTLREEDKNELAQKTDLKLYRPMAEKYDSVEAMSEGYFRMVRQVFERDDYHQPMIFFFQGLKPLKFFGYEIQDRAQKYLMNRSLAQEALRYGADVVLMVNEAWIAPMNEVGPYEFAVDAPNRQEALTMVLVRKDGDLIHHQAMIIRENDKPVLGETGVTRNPATYTAAPFYDAWGRPIPDNWTRKVQPSS
ncbi:MAG: hypothetical protein E5Y63_11615 [Mesorhizobium sp.]|uniref:hypothetical protein n=1 Tax=Mesorhizobium sp. TaxID=1871066 RepID=UPI0012015825|nr:hypothetical protein [Mesorhizobium sp.]TIM30344.1 MAG: hypothetical protein E5Y63_11615 [Mesorhizobium sp.]